MTVAEVLEQAKKLSVEERKELAKRLIDIIDEPQPTPTADEPTEHWGKALNQLLDKIGPIEMLYPEIEDPVKWVEHLREEKRRRRFGDWGEEA